MTDPISRIMKIRDGMTPDPDAAAIIEREIAALQPHSSPDIEQVGALVNSAYDELCVRFSGVHSDDAMDSVLLRLHAALKKLSIDPTAPYIAPEMPDAAATPPCPGCDGHECIRDGKYYCQYPGAAATPSDPVAWRWRHVNDDKHEWNYQDQPIRNHSEYLQVEPLYGALAQPSRIDLGEDGMAQHREKVRR